MLLYSLSFLHIKNKKKKKDYIADETCNDVFFILPMLFLNALN